MKLSLYPLLISAIAFTISLMAQADSMCGDDGYFVGAIGACQGYNGGVWSVGSRGSRNVQQHTPRDYYGAVAVDLQGGDRAHNSNNYRSANEAKQAALKGCRLPGCKVIIAYKNGCGTAAYSSDTHVVGGIGDSPEEAEQNALEKCEETKHGGQCQIWTHFLSCSYYQ